MISRKPLVLIDVDGVLGDFLTPTVHIANRLFGLEADPKNLNQWDIGKWLELTPEQEKELYDEVKSPGFHSRINVYEGAKEGIKAIREIADIHIVTSAMFGKTWCSDRWNWLYDHFEIKAKDVTFTHRKELFSANAIVDDKPKTVERWAIRHDRRLQHGCKSRAFLWHQHYNAHVEVPLAMRVSSWSEVVEVIALL